ncbi:MAG: energy-coupled thiamine transporter ThiT [Oscillospiraceae bacterium]|nr:energy-coupled thiamine transporter ThiT [Oscillospiraceae bacterium]
MASTQNVKVLRLVESGLLVAIGIILDTFFKFEAPWAYGGSITLFAMLPLVIVAYKYGICWGAFAGLAHGLITLLISGGGASGLAAMVQENGPAVFAGILILDYILAFSSVGLSGLAARFMKSTAGALSVGAVIGLCCRFLCHFVSGFLLFGSYADWFFGQTSWGQWFLDHFSGAGLSAIYSLVYNGLYMIPEIILTAIGGAIVGRLLHTQLQKNRTTHTA